MSAAATATAVRMPVQFEGTDTQDTTLLELVDAVCDVTSNDEEVVATVLYLLRSGRARLCGNFRGEEQRLD
jgi:hypothetical protein